MSPQGLYSPWNSPGQNTGVGSLSFHQGIFPTQGSNPGLPHCRQILYQLSHRGSPRPRVWLWIRDVKDGCASSWSSKMWSSWLMWERGADGESICLQCRRPGFDPWVGKIPWRRKWQPTPVFLPGKSHGQKSLAHYSPWGRKESDVTE